MIFDDALMMLWMNIWVIFDDADKDFSVGKAMIFASQMDWWFLPSIYGKIALMAKLAMVY